MASRTQAPGEEAIEARPRCVAPAGCGAARRVGAAHARERRARPREFATSQLRCRAPIRSRRQQPPKFKGPQAASPPLGEESRDTKSATASCKRGRGTDTPAEGSQTNNNEQGGGNVAGRTGVATRVRSKSAAGTWRARGVFGRAPRAARMEASAKKRRQAQRARQRRTTTEANEGPRALGRTRRGRRQDGARRGDFPPLNVNIHHVPSP